MWILRVSGRRRAALLAAALALASVLPAAAQELQPGMRVRVTAPISSRTSRFVGTVEAADSARLTLRLDPAVRREAAGDTTVMIPRVLIQRVEVSLGRAEGRRTQAAVTGAVAGAFVGATVGLVLGDRRDDLGRPSNAWETAAIAAPLGAAAGAGAGWLVGQPPHEVWRRMPGYAVGVPPGGGIALAVRLWR